MKYIFLLLLLLPLFSLYSQPADSSTITISSDDDSTYLIIGREKKGFSNNDMAQMYFGEGLESANTGDYETAVEKFKLALLYDTDNGEIYYNLGLAEYFLKEYEDAIAAFNAATDYDPDNAMIYNQRALCKAFLENYGDAETDFKIMLKYDPDFPMGVYNYGVLLLEEGKTEDACALIHRAEDLGYTDAQKVADEYCR